MKSLRVRLLRPSGAVFAGIISLGLVSVALSAPPSSDTRVPAKKGGIVSPQPAPPAPRPAARAKPPLPAGFKGARAGAATIATLPTSLGESSPAQTLEFADAFPSGPRPPAPDLLLAQDGARKAEAQAAFARALVAEDNADGDEALAGYRKVLELDPSYADLAVKVAYELARRNDVAGGIQVLKDAIKAAPKEPLPLIYLSQLYSKYLKKPDLALKYAEQAMALAPDNFNAHNAIFELYLSTGDTRKAEAILDRAATSKSVDPKYWLQLGDLSTRLYLKEDGSSPPAEQERMNAIYRKAAELGKEDANVQAKAGDYFVLSRQVKEAIPFYLLALQGKLDGDENAHANLRDKLARAFLVTEQRDEAIKMLEQLVSEKPLRFETHELLGELYEKNGEMDKALASYEHSLTLDSTRPDNYLRVAEMYRRQKNPDKVVEVLVAAREKFRDLPRITWLLARTLKQAKRHTEAMTAFGEAMADARNGHEEMLDAGFYLEYGAAAEQAGLTDRAAELLQEAIRLDPDNSGEAYNYLGYMWTDREMNLDEAGKMIQKALELEPDNGAYLDSLGWFFFKKGDHQKALQELLRAADLIPPEDAGEVYDHLGDTCEKLAKMADALSYWHKALALDKENKKIAAKIEATKTKVTQTAPAPDKTKTE